MLCIALSAARRIAVLLAVAAWGLPPSAAEAARAWTHAPAAPHDAFDADAAITALDETAIVWNRGGGPVYAEVRQRGAGDGPETELDAGPTYWPEVVTDGAGGAAAVWLAYVEGEGYRVRTAQRLAGGAFGPAVDVANATLFLDAAMNPRGDLAVLYEWFNADFTAKRYYVAIRPAGAPAFLPGQPIAGDIPDDEWWFTGPLALAPEGDVLVSWRDGTWDKGGREWVVRRPAAGPGFGPPQLLSAPGARAGIPVAAFDTAGRAVAAWPESPEGKHSGPVRAALAQPGLPFGAPSTIGPDASSDAPTQVDTGPGGAAVVAWEEYHVVSETFGDGWVERSGWIGETRAVRADLVAGTFSEAFGVTLDMGSRPIVAMTSAGVPAVFYEDFRTLQLRVARGGSAGGFDAPETITCPRPYGDPRAAFFDSHGDAGLLWRRWSGRPLPAFMLSRDAAAEQQSPSSCPPIPPALTITPEIAPPGQSRRLDLSGAVEPGEEGKRFSWDLDGNGEYEIEESEDPAVDHVFTERGRHTIWWRVHHEHGSFGDSAEVVVTDPPHAELTADPPDPATGSTVRLDASGSSDPDGRIVTYHWDTDGDGAENYYTSDAVTFMGVSEPGEHKVGVTVEDDLGATTRAELVLDVRQADEREPDGGGATARGADAAPAPLPGDPGPPATGGGSRTEQSSVAPGLTVAGPRSRSARSVRRRGLRVVLTASRGMTVVLRLAGGPRRIVSVPANRPLAVRERAPRAKARPRARLTLTVNGVPRLTVVVRR
jgi:hypothetical protein